ncbi:MAG: hypothetical protein EOO77_07855 [Oxalobacteraceae bacterium]|nr:MAG: hypothetical protein EOO77_07855 [Oxalobacteraceae bacterium]
MIISREQRFRRSPQITFTAQLKPREAAALRKWSQRVPTIYFLDIMMVDAAKRSLTKGLRDAHKGERVIRLRRLDKPGNAFSYLLAMLEKASDPREKLTRDELADKIRRDTAALTKFTRRARFYEPPELVEQCLRDIQGSDIESMTPRYIEFLNAMNTRLNLGDKVKVGLRFAKAVEIFAEADALDVPRGHPIVLVTLGCLYGNDDARGILKFGHRATKPFDPVNVLADIMLIRRFVEKKVEIEDMGRRGLSPFLRAELVTDDKSLACLVPFFEATAVTHVDGVDGSLSNLKATVHFARLLTDLGLTRDAAEAAGVDGEEIEPDEYDRICDLIFRPDREDAKRSSTSKPES